MRSVTSGAHSMCRRGVGAAGEGGGDRRLGEGEAQRVGEALGRDALGDRLGEARARRRAARAGGAEHGDRADDGVQVALAEVEIAQVLEGALVGLRRVRHRRVELDRPGPAARRRGSGRRGPRCRAGRRHREGVGAGQVLLEEALDLAAEVVRAEVAREAGEDAPRDAHLLVLADGEGQVMDRDPRACRPARAVTSASRKPRAT